MKKKVIWSNYNLDYEDWKDFFDDEYPDLDEDKRIDLMYELNNEHLDDERMNLDIPVPRKSSCSVTLASGTVVSPVTKKSTDIRLKIACIQIPTTQRGISMIAAICAVKPFIMMEPTTICIGCSSRT